MMQHLFDPFSSWKTHEDLTSTQCVKCMISNLSMVGLVAHTHFHRKQTSTCARSKMRTFSGYLSFSLLVNNTHYQFPFD